MMKKEKEDIKRKNDLTLAENDLFVWSLFDQTAFQQIGDGPALNR